MLLRIVCVLYSCEEIRVLVLLYVIYKCTPPCTYPPPNPPPTTTTRRLQVRGRHCVAVKFTHSATCKQSFTKLYKTSPRGTQSDRIISVAGIQCRLFALVAMLIACLAFLPYHYQ